jgi:DNA-binding NarL/FixJ family response regulator
LLVSACVRLEGLPLAIELAAARLKALTPGELVFRLSSRMEVLAGSTRDVPVRQRALRSAIAWSYDLLDSGERALFRRLSVFAGSWTLADAGSVCVANGNDALAMVESLLDKSLIRRLPGDEQTAEFSMLESLREYAAEQLASHAEAEETRARHAGHYAGLAAQFEASIGLPEERAWVLRAGRHHADLRAALDYCLGAGRDDWALWLAAALGWYHYTGDLGAGQAAVDAVLPLTADGYDPAAMSDDTMAGGQAGVLIVAGALAWATGEMGRAQDLLRSALQRSEGRGDARRAAIACAFLGHVARAGGDWDASADWHRRAEAGFRDGGQTHGVAWARYDLGLLARDHGDLGSAAELLRASLQDFRELDYPWAVAWSAWGLGTTLSAWGRLEEACPLLAEALRICNDVNDHRGVAQCLEALAHVAASERAHYESAARLIGAAAALRERVAARQLDTEQARTSSVKRVLARALGLQDADTLMHEGRTMPVQQAADLAIAVALGTAPGDPDRSHQVPLTPRERQVAALVASGRTNRQIGRVLGISEKTAEVHLHHVMSKLDARSRAEVAAWAVTHHLSAPA